jgi:hypothetical protein
MELNASGQRRACRLLILTEWKEFAGLDLPRVRELLAYPIVLDGRNLYRPEAMAEAGLNYYSVGRSPVEVLLPKPFQAKAALNETRIAS